MKQLTFLAIILILFGQCKMPEKKAAAMNTGISETTINETLNSLAQKFGNSSKDLVMKGVKHAGSLWRPEDGTEEDFTKFCIDYFIADPIEKTEVFKKSCKYFESLFGHFSQLTLELRENLDLNTGSLNKIDEMFGSYSAGAHFSDDFFKNKIAFIIALNFPYYSLEEKNELSKGWNEKDWAFARLGDIFVNRIPAELQQKVSRVSSGSDLYISQYRYSLDKADIAIVFYDPEVVSRKKLPELKPEVILAAFGRKNLIVISDKNHIEPALMNQKTKNSTLLLMTSGNFSGLDMNSLAENYIIG